MTKAKLPTKTKIAVWWLKIIGVLVTIWAIVSTLMLLLQSLWNSPTDDGFLCIFLLLSGIFVILSSISLPKISKSAWIFAISLLVFAMLCSLGAYLYLSIDFTDYSLIPIILILGSLIYLPPLILLILDRKNYFEMVRQREREKKAAETGQSTEQK